MESTPIKTYALLHFIVLIWGFTAILGLLISLPPVELVMYRTGLASIGLALLVGLGRRSLHISNYHDFRAMISVGVLLAGHWILFFLAARLSNASVCLAGMATTSLWTSLIEPVYFGKKIKKIEVILSLVAFGGIALIFNVEWDYSYGILFSILSAMAGALFTVINARITQYHDHFVITFYEMIIAFLCILAFLPIYFFISGQQPIQWLPKGWDWLYLILLSGVCTVFAFSYSVKIMRKLSAFAVNLTVNLEPIYGIALALLIFGDTEKMSVGFYVGTIAILASVLLYPYFNGRNKRKSIQTDLLR